MGKLTDKPSVKNPKGFTLIELIITVVIAGIIVAIAAPNFNSFVRKSHIITTSNGLIASLNLARSESIKRNINVTLRRKGSTTKVWDDGGDIFTDSTSTGTIGTLDDDGDANLCEIGEDCLIKTFDALPNGYTLRTGGIFALGIVFTKRPFKRLKRSVQ